jgi:hypothetical protein
MDDEMDLESVNHDARQLRRMLDCIVAARSGNVSLVQVAGSLLFLRDALEVVDEQWEDTLTSHIMTLESAGLASAEQKVTMGSAFENVIATALGELEVLTRSHPAYVPDTPPSARY